MKKAVIDISANSISMVIAENTNGKLTVFHKEKMPISLFNYIDSQVTATFTNGDFEEMSAYEHCKLLSPFGLEKLVETLKKLIETATNMGSGVVHIIATSALRNIQNVQQVKTTVKQETGIELVLIGGLVEAYCDFKANIMYKDIKDCVLVDVGGGSIQVVDFANTSLPSMICLNFGVIKIFDKFVDDVQPEEEEVKRIKKYIGKKIKEKLFAKQYQTAVICGSINQAIYDVYKDFFGIKEQLVKKMENDKLKKLAKALTNPKKRSSIILKSAPEKINTLAIGLLVLRRLLKTLQVKQCIVSDFGVKEGYVIATDDGTFNQKVKELQQPKKTKGVVTVQGDCVNGKQEVAKKKTAKAKQETQQKTNDAETAGEEKPKKPVEKATTKSKQVQKNSEESNETTKA